MALHEAIDKGADEALMMDANGFISEGSGENIFIVKDNVLLTPSLNCCLNGITRRSVIQFANDEGIEVVERVKHAFPPNPHNREYLKTKAAKTGHLF